jgi:hypothetical protein
MAIHYSKRFGLRRLGSMLGGIAILVAALLVLSDSGNDVVGKHRTKATVLAVHRTGKLPTALPKPAVVEVKLGDGGRAKLFLNEPVPSPNTTIAVTVTEYADGKRIVTAVE